VDDADVEDTLVDLAADPGCFEALDNDEKDVTQATGAPDCGPPGTTAYAWLDLNIPAAAQIVGHRLVNVANGMVLHQEANAGHIATQTIDIGCGAGINVTLEDGAGASAPNPGGTTGVPPPAPPAGEQTFRFLIKIENPAASSNLGTNTPATVRGSVNTR
jgi:hypothetical protein